MCLSPFNNEVYMTNHGAKGGDWFGKVNYGGNYGWDKLYWGGTKYSGLKGGPKWLPGYDKPIKYYVPSIAISACQIYKGEEFQEWNGSALIAALKSAKTLSADQKCLVILPDGIRNYMTKFPNDNWMKSKGLSLIHI